jgi:hypothetical protein
MTIQYSLTHRTNAATQLNTDIGANAVIKVFTGTAPANCGTADSGTVLVTFAGNAGGFGSVASQVLTASAVANATAGNTGTAGYFRIYPSAATSTNAVVQGTCGLSAADMILTNTSITSGQTCVFTSLTVTPFGV